VDNSAGMIFAQAETNVKNMTDAILWYSDSGRKTIAACEKGSVEQTKLKL